MINDLRYAVTFPTNGISLTGTHTFQPGITTISGRNGSGKSFIREMLRYGLFGKKALRGPASDYKTLDMSLSFQIGETKYHVTRGKREFLYDTEGGEPIAVGADAVNKKIIDVLGFGLEVFDVVCAVNQKESERLTQLTPAKRKELIDDVVGLATQEAAEGACRKEALGYRREAETLMRVIKAPVEPVKPEGYRPSREIEVDLRATKTLVEERARLQRIVDAVPTPPQAPAEPEVDVAALEEHEERRVQIEARRAALAASIARIPNTAHVAAELDAAEALLEYDAEVKRRGVTPTYSIEQLDHLEAVLDANAKAADEVTCPGCDLHFHPGLTAEEEKLAQQHCDLTRQQIAGERRSHENWATPLDQPKGERMTAAEIRTARAALDRAAEKRQLQAELDAVLTLTDKSAELRAGRATNEAWAIFRRENDRYVTAHDAAGDACIELDRLGEPKHTVPALDAAFVAARVYESQLVSYDADKAQFDKLAAEIAEKQTKADGFTAGAKGLVEARRTLKAFLAPSLSRVASSLIQHMTANAKLQLTSIDVDEDMNITADGQDVATFNGAHATMINLALRLALQQVLVSRVFPVFIGDEIDSDCDPANSQAIVDALVAVKDQLRQIILISHKRLEGMDAEISLDA